jgi:arylsulfatase
MYAAYTAPHWPLQATEETIANSGGRYDEGWDVLRERRMQRLRATGLLATSSGMRANTEEAAWEDTEHKAREARRMGKSMRPNCTRWTKVIGTILDTLEETGQLENTLIFFMSDNGACAEVLPLDGSAEAFKKRRPDLERLKPRNGSELQVGNAPAIVPGPEDTYASYGRAWKIAHPTHLFGSTSAGRMRAEYRTPLIVHWPAGQLNNGSIVFGHLPAHRCVANHLRGHTSCILNLPDRNVPKCEGSSFLSICAAAKPPNIPCIGSRQVTPPSGGSLEVGMRVSSSMGALTTWKPIRQK